jgi:hypothetical protein
VSIVCKNLVITEEMKMTYRFRISPDAPIPVGYPNRDVLLEGFDEVLIQTPSEPFEWKTDNLTQLSVWWRDGVPLCYDGTVSEDEDDVLDFRALRDAVRSGGVVHEPTRDIGAYALRYPDDQEYVSYLIPLYALQFVDLHSIKPGRAVRALANEGSEAKVDPAAKLLRAIAARIESKARNDGLVFSKLEIERAYQEALITVVSAIREVVK